MTIKQYDTIRLKDGRVGVVVEVFGETDFLVDVGYSPADWETVEVSIDEIETVIND